MGKTLNAKKTSHAGALRKNESQWNTMTVYAKTVFCCNIVRNWWELENNDPIESIKRHFHDGEKSIRKGFGGSRISVINRYQMYHNYLTSHEFRGKNT